MGVNMLKKKGRDKEEWVSRVGRNAQLYKTQCRGIGQEGYSQGEAGMGISSGIDPHGVDARSMCHWAPVALNEGFALMN